MVELAARTWAEGLDLPLEAGGVTLQALPEQAMVSIAPFRGRGGAVSDWLARVGGARLPDPGRTSALPEGCVAWSGIDQWLLSGPLAPAACEALAGLAAVTDQSDAWAGLRLRGDAAPDVLARLAPIDLDAAVFPAGSVARTCLRHIACVLSASDAGFEIRVMRSFASSAVHDLGVAMRSVAALRLIRGA